MRALTIGIVVLASFLLFGCGNQGASSNFEAESHKPNVKAPVVGVATSNIQPDRYGTNARFSKNIQVDAEPPVVNSAETQIPVQTMAPQPLQNNDLGANQPESVPQQSGATQEEVLAEQQRDIDAREKENRITLIKNAAKKYNEMLASFEFMPAQYQEIADQEVEMILGSVVSSGRSGSGIVPTPKTHAMEMKIMETANNLTDLYKQVMDTDQGKELYSRGPMASARNSGIERIHTNVFNSAAKTVESFPYLLAR